MKHRWALLAVPLLALPLTTITAAGAAPAVPACRVPADVLDLGTWKETLPIGPAGHPTEITQPQLAAYAKSPYFTTTPACDGVVFRAPVDGTTTSGSGYPRSELRQMTGDGTKTASWSTTSGTHTMVLDEAVTHLPADKPDVVVGQIHDADDDVTVFRLEGTDLYLTKGDDSHYRLVTRGYELGTRFRVSFTAHDGKVSAYYNDTLVATIAVKSSGDYFKAGTYTQANCGNSAPCSADNYGETVVYGLTVSG
ncbi:polysaccharide lyase family 7 protein [Amycolatopsis rhabdoformis]|uniref:Polysaccharide lyase family 7 protein n=1 Tax=Amycolatopsis rhabdoformis TaxID=1448059 RepID=A0ABZ1IBG9_9PSEU|nr:polysaccharide lyase family 7 protein [Amycolatopsis rhabdoformis]WSE31752.1 polysaccharide lyase family 7 protein [Amycolatopsis rhabdoformis]